jgi:hypothetical protein
MKVVTRKEITAPIPLVKKNKVKRRPTPETADASPINPVFIKAWVWKSCPAPEDVKPEGEEGEEEKPRPRKKPDRNTDDWLHLNTRRHRARVEGKQEAS